MNPGWDRRIARAALLKEKISAAAELLNFYEKIAKFQRAVPNDGSPLVDCVGPLLALVERDGPALLAEAAVRFRRDPAAWPTLVGSVATEPIPAFFGHVLRQSRAVYAALTRPVPYAETRATCPFCGERPAVAVLRPEGEGGKRRLVCSLCFTEWEFRRLLCPNCAEENQDRLPVYTAKEFEHIRVEACDTCQHYIKSVDLTRDGLAVAEVDDLAAVPLDLWAAERNYAKICPNLLGF